MKNGVQLPSRQAGLGALGWLVVLAIASFFLTCFFKLGPVYLDYWQVKQALDEAVADPELAALSKQELIAMIGRNLDVNRIEVVKINQLRINETSAGRELDASYEKRVPLLHNIDVVVKFDQLKYTLPVR
jgi:hypothetical protein